MEAMANYANAILRHMYSVGGRLVLVLLAF